MTPTVLTARGLIPGQARAPLLWTDVALSFWGGIDPASGRVIDQHHPLRGRSVARRVLALPDGRGSCTGSTVMLELLLGRHAPAALVLAEPDDILTLGVLVAEQLFGRRIPVAVLSHEDHARLARARTVSLVPADMPADLPTDRPTNRPTNSGEDDSESDDHADHGGGNANANGGDDRSRASRAGGAHVVIETREPARAPVALSARDQALLDGRHGEAARVALRILRRMAELTGAPRLLDITRAHIDACIYTGPASLRFARHLRDLGARFTVPTTLNAISLARRGWRAQGVDAASAEPADALAQAYRDMGAASSYTCAPYHLPGAPRPGEQIAWAESNAVVYANSVLAARTAKYPDFLEVLAAITGRAPATGCHLDAPRQPTLRLAVQAPPAQDATPDFYPLAGYAAGQLAGRQVALIEGLAHLRPSDDELRAFCAAYATTSSAPLLHIDGITPEARQGRLDTAGIRQARTLPPSALAQAWRELNSGGVRIDLVALGNPHFSAAEFAELARLCAGRRKAESTALIVTTSRHVYAQAEAAGHLRELRAFGAQVVQDTCWCMLREPVVPPGARVIATPSAKYAHYAGGLVGRATRLASLADCVRAACSGQLPLAPPGWLARATVPATGAAIATGTHPPPSHPNRA